MKGFGPGARVLGVLGVLVALAPGACGGRAAPTCSSAAADGDWRRAIPLCQARYERTRDPRAGLGWARGLSRLHDWEGAMRVAQLLLETPVRIEAYDILGYAATRVSDLTTSLEAWKQALAGHLAAGNTERVAPAAHGLAGALLSSGDMAGAEFYEQMAIAKAAAIGDRSWSLFYELGRADILRQRGQQHAAEQLLEGVGEPQTEFHRKWFFLKRGILYVSLEIHEAARRDLTLALELAGGDTDVKNAALLNLAWVERVEGDAAASLRYVEEAKAAGADDQDTHFLRGLALHAGARHAEAAAELQAANALQPQGQWSWALPYYQGLVAQALGDEAQAINAYEASALAVRALTERAGAYIPEVAASHREPYQRLFGIHAARGDWEAAFEVVMRLDMLSLLTSEKPPVAGKPEADVRSHPAPPLIHDPPPVAEVLAAWRGRHLVVLISDEQTMWRLEVRGGQVRGAAVGAAAELEELARALEARPDNAAAAARLGEAVVPPGGAGARLGGEAGGLDVLLIGAVGRVPLPALQRRGQLVIATTPLGRMLGVLPRRLTAAPRSGVVVFGDPNQNLPRAKQEAAAVGQALGVEPLLGAAVTQQAMTAARGKALLHLAGHSQLTPEGAILHLADRSIGAGEICRLAPAPAVTVLASCGAAAARDDAGWGSLAAAFLDAGSEAVIAASSDVDDGATAQLMQELYRHDVAGQPARALAQTQVKMSRSLPPRGWSAFEVLRAPPIDASGTVDKCAAPAPAAPAATAL